MKGLPNREKSDQNSKTEKYKTTPVESEEDTEGPFYTV